MSEAPTRPPGLRRRLVKKVGKYLFHGLLLDFLARQSRLPDVPMFSAENFEWVKELQADWPAIREELDTQLAHRASLPSFQEISPDQYRISTDDQWKTFLFVGFGHPSELNRELCPRTAAALDKVPTLTTAFFSVLGPGKHIPEHRGVTKGLVRCHLGLSVPDEAERCVMQVGPERCRWHEGELLFFDDTYPHEVWNETPRERAVLLFDFARPMTTAGRRVSRALLAGLRQTAYFKDGLRNQAAWERRYTAHGASST